MSKQNISDELLKKCKAVTAKRPRVVIDHILKHGFITTEDLKNIYGYNHPPRAVRDVRKNGIPLDTYRVTGTDGRKIAAYKFSMQQKEQLSKRQGRTAFNKLLKKKLIEKFGKKCAIYLESFDERELQIDHRIPFEVSGEIDIDINNIDSFMLLCASANRAKSWSCEHCSNWQEQKDPEICKSCYWAFPKNYTHVAMQQHRRVDILWINAEIAMYEHLKKHAQESHMEVSQYIKTIIKKHLSD